ncbi:UNVERIFIED_CONTAM: zinc finger protein [Trichonephila clavipes]
MSMNTNLNNDCCYVVSLETFVQDNHLNVQEKHARVFSCHICHRQFNRKFNLKVHQRTHTGERPFTCELCSIHFITRSNWKVHCRRWHSNNITLVLFPVEDPLLPKLIFVNIVHTKHCIGELRDCMRDLMPYGFQQPLNEIITQSEHMGTPRFQLRLYDCEICKKSFKQKVHLQDHMRSHTLEKPFKCHLCPQAFNRKSSAKQFFHSSSTSLKKYFCEVCFYSTNDGSNLRRHQRIHTKQLPYVCSICKKAFSRHDTVSKYWSGIYLMKQFFFNKTFKCLHVSVLMSIVTSFFMKIFIIISVFGNEEAPKFKFACDKCRFSTNDSSSLKFHYRIHYHLRKFICHYCQKSFSQKYNLNTHMRVHTGEKPFECNLCNFRCAFKYSLNYHMMSQHSGN